MPSEGPSSPRRAPFQALPRLSLPLQALTLKLLVTCRAMVCTKMGRSDCSAPPCRPYHVQMWIERDRPSHRSRACGCSTWTSMAARRSSFCCRASSCSCCASGVSAPAPVPPCPLKCTLAEAQRSCSLLMCTMHVYSILFFPRQVRTDGLYSGYTCPPYCVINCCIRLCRIASSSASSCTRNPLTPSVLGKNFTL